MTAPNAAKVEELRKGFKGKVITPSDNEYEESRKIWNGMVDKRPAIIARCAGTQDAVKAVNFAATTGFSLPSAARATTLPAIPCATTASLSIFRT